MSGIQPADRDNAVSVSLRGRWAVMESDQKGRDRLKKDIENWKLLVHRQRQSEKRVVYAQTLITMVTFTGDMDLLKDVFSWLLGRFLKDVDFRNTVFRNYMHYISRCLAGNKKNLQVSAQVGDELIASCIDALSKARMEPDFDINHYYGTYHLIRKVLVSRVWLCERLRVEMDATETLLAPLEKLWIQLEKISLEDHGTFGDPKQYPLRVERGGHYWNGFCHSTEEDASTFGTYFRSTVDLSLQSRRVVVRFLDRLGRSRDQLYADLRDDPERTCQELSGYESRSPWPLEVQESFLEGVPMHQDAPFFLEYLRKIIFLPLDKDNRTEKDVTSGQWQEALRFYASIARYDPGSRDDMLGSVIEHYRTKPVKSDASKVDLAPHLLAVKEFMDVVHSSERLTHLMFSPYNATDSDYSRLNLPLDIERSSFENQIELDVNFNLLKRRQTDITRVNMVQNIVPEHTLRGSHQLRRHLTILAATLWINSLAGIEKGDKGYQLLQGDSKQLNFAALYANSGLPDISYVRYGGSWVKRRFFAANVDVLSKEELHNLIEYSPYTSSPRSHSPTLMEEDIFEILRDPEHSSIHRYFLTSSLLGVVSPDESKRLTRRFVDQTVEAIKTGAMLDDESTSKDTSEAIEESEAIELVDPEEADSSDTMDELESTEQAEPTDGTDESKSKPAIKVSTIKCVVCILAQPVTGFDVQEVATQLNKLLVGSVHPSLQETVLTQLGSIIGREALIQPSAVLSVIRDTLGHFAHIASSLDEWRLLTDDDWVKPSLPKITGMESTRASCILSTAVTNLPAEDRQRWALMVDEMLANQVRDTHRWICEFLRRHKVTGEIETVEREPFGPLLTCFQSAAATSYTSLRKYLPPDSWHLRIIRRQITGYIVAHRLHLTTLQLDVLEPKWRSKEDGKDFVTLLTKWTNNHVNSFSTLVTLLKEFGDDDVQQVLRDAILDHLQLSNITIAPGKCNPQWRNVPWTAFDQLLAYLKPDLTQQAHLVQGWKSNIRPLLEWTLQQAQTARAQAGQNGNQYDHIITRIKAYLLPFPGLYPELGGDYIKYATELYELVLESYSTPLLHQAWLFDSLIPNIQRGSGGLVPMTWTLMTLLVKEAEARLDPTERLLGYRLVQVVGDNIHPIVTREDRSEITNLLLSMEDHKDPNVRLLALNIGRERRYDVPKPEKAEPEAQQTQPASQRGRGRGRGRARGRGRGRR